MTDQHDRDSGARAVEVARSFVSLADTLVDDFDVVELFDRLVRYCVDLLEVDAAAIMLTSGDGTLEVVGSSDEASQLMDVFALQGRSGPSAEVIRTGEPIAVTDLAELLGRWPAFGAAVEAMGFSALHVLPLRLREDKIGALNLFNADHRLLPDFDLRLAQAMADVASIAILQQRALTRASVLAEQLQRALDTRIRVEQAKGVVAEFGGLDMGEAFEALRAYARSHRAKLSDVADSVVSRALAPEEILATDDRVGRRRPPAREPGGEE